jgi:uncharacterized protein (TIGR00251 family)
VPPVKASKEGVCVDVHVTPSSGEDSLRWVDGVLKVKTKVPADRGRANKAVVEILKPFFGACDIVTGHRSRRKTVCIRNRDEEAVKACLEELCGGRIG